MSIIPSTVSQNDSSFFSNTQDTSLRIPGRRNAKYKLTGIIVHRRLVSQEGHYTSFFLSSEIPKQWFHADDSHVHLAYCCHHTWISTNGNSIYTATILMTGFPSQCWHCCFTRALPIILRTRRRWAECCKNYLLCINIHLSLSRVSGSYS